jgi:hypothetical protein
MQRHDLAEHEPGLSNSRFEMTQDVTTKRIKSGWILKALTPKARTVFLNLLRMPADIEGEVFIQGVTEERYPMLLQLLAVNGLNLDPPPKEKVDLKRYTDF